MGRRSALVAAAATVAAVVLASSGASATSSQESQFVSLINSERTSRGMSAVAVRSDLAAVARDWSQHMAADGDISHDPDLANEVDGWTKLGDNVGRGTSVSQVHEAFMRSSSHSSIMLDPGFNQVGVGVAQAGDTIYVTQVFVKRGTSTVVRRTTTTTTKRRTTVTRRSTIGSARTVTYMAALTGVVWEIDFGSRPLTVSVLQRLIGLDAAHVDPTTGIPD
jgi:hypothetical protein